MARWIKRKTKITNLWIWDKKPETTLSFGNTVYHPREWTLDLHDGKGYLISGKMFSRKKDAMEFAERLRKVM